MPGDASTRTGYVLLAGLPNAGKSTLLNALVEEALSVTSFKAQTTWQRIVGVRTEGDTQMVFVDTPGLLVARNLFQRSMLAEAVEARDEADVLVCVVDGTQLPTGDRAERLFGFAREASVPRLFALNKMDAVADPARAVEELSAVAPSGRVLPVSAQTGEGLDALLETIGEALPPGPFLFPEDQIAQAPTRFFVQEMIRGAIFDNFDQEIPYASAVRVDAFRESEDPIYIAATVFVERKSQKGIVVGKGGAGVRRLGQDARRRIEHFLGARVYLDLWVKVAEKWRRDRKGLKRFGYRIPDEKA